MGCQAAVKKLILALPRKHYLRAKNTWNLGLNTSDLEPKIPKNQADQSFPAEPKIDKRSTSITHGPETQQLRHK